MESSTHHGGGEHAGHVAQVARRGPVLLPALKVKHLGHGMQVEAQQSVNIT